MNSVRNFVRLDGLAFKPYRKYLLFTFLPPLFSILTLKNIESMAVLFGASMALIMSFMMYGHLFASEEKSGMSRLYGALPMDKKDVVIGRYTNCIIMGLGNILVGALLMGLCSFVVAEIKLSEVVFFYSLTVGTFFLCLALQLPLLFKLGFIKGQYPATVAPILAFYVLLFTGRGLMQTLSHFQNYLGIILVFVGLLCLAVSLRISIGIYQEKQG